MKLIILLILTFISSIGYSQEYLEYRNSSIVFEKDTIRNCIIQINKQDKSYIIKTPGFSITFYYDDFNSSKNNSLFLFKTNGEYLYISENKLKFKSNNIEIYN